MFRYIDKKRYECVERVQYFENSVSYHKANCFDLIQEDKYNVEDHIIFMDNNAKQIKEEEKEKNCKYK